MQRPDHERVVITGRGLVAPGGNSVSELFANLLAQRSAVRVHEYESPGHSARFLGAAVEVDFEQHFSKLELLMQDRVALLSLMSARQAMSEAGWDKASRPHDAGVFWGTGFGGGLSLQEGYRQFYLSPENRLRPTLIPKVMHNACAGHLAIAWHLHGPSPTFSCACASSAVAIGEAYWAVRSGRCSVAIAGGADTMLSHSILKAWDAAGALAKVDLASPQTACRPFSRDRSGFVLGEGAGAVVLESLAFARARGATIWGELSGYGISTDATHIVQPDSKGQVLAMQLALTTAALEPAAIDAINAHGTATVLGDAQEVQSIRTLLGARARSVPVSATKALHGHLMGAAGVVEFIVALESIRQQILPPTAHLEHPDPDCDLDFVADGARKVMQLNHVLSSSFAFGGTNAVLIASRMRTPDIAS